MNENGHEGCVRRSDLPGGLRRVLNVLPTDQWRRIRAVVSHLPETDYAVLATLRMDKAAYLSGRRLCRDGRQADQIAVVRARVWSALIELGLGIEAWCELIEDERGATMLCEARMRVAESVLEGAREIFTRQGTGGPVDRDPKGSGGSTVPLLAVGKEH